MASFDDGNTCTIETDSGGPSMTPTSCTMRTSVDGHEDNYLNDVPRMPMHLQIEYTDAIIINAEGDVQSARRFQNQLLRTTLVTRDKEEVNPKVKLISEIPGFEQEILTNIAIAFKKTNYIFLFATKSLCDPKSILSRLETVLMQDAEKKNIIPVNTKNKKTRDYSLGPLYSSVKPIEFWSTDQFFVKSVQRLFEMKIDNRLKKDRELEYERKEWSLELKKRQIFGQLGQKLHPEGITASPIVPLPKEMQRHELKENSGLYVQNQSLHNPGPHVEPISNTHIQVDGPTLPSAVPAPHHYPHAQSCSQYLPPIKQYGFGEIPHEHMLSHTPPMELGSQRYPFYTQQTVPSSSFPYTSNSSSMQRRSFSSQAPTSSLEVQPSASDFPNQAVPNPRFTQVQKENASMQPIPVFYYPHYPPIVYPHPPSQAMASPYDQFPLDPPQVIRLPGASNPSFTTQTTYGHFVQGGNQSHASSTSESTSQTSGPSFQFARDTSVPQSSSAPSTQSGIVQNITININNVETAAIGSNPKLIQKYFDSSDEEDDVSHGEDSDSSDTLSNQEKNPGLGNKRSEKDEVVFSRSSGGRLSTANEVFHPSSTRQPVSASNMRESSRSSDIEEPYSQRNAETTLVKQFITQRDEGGNVMTHETAVKQIFED